MNCLECVNYWRTNINEIQYDKCGTQESATNINPKESEDKSNEHLC